MVKISVEPGFEPGAAGWKAKMLTLCYADPTPQARKLITLKLTSPGKIQTLANATREQRREYKAKFVDMDVEFGRLKERMETLNMILDDMQVSQS